MPEVFTAIPANTGEDFYGEIIRENLDNRILVLNNQIDADIMEGCILRILKWNREDEGLPIDSRKRIIFYIDCPGGETVTGLNMIDVICQSKTPIVGVGFSLVASMGYHIFLACHERIAFANTVFLQHDGDLIIQNSTSKAKDTMLFFDSMDKRLKAHVLNKTKMDEDFYDKIYDQEYWMFSDTAKDLGIVDKIIGVDCDIDVII